MKQNDFHQINDFAERTETVEPLPGDRWKLRSFNFSKAKNVIIFILMNPQTTIFEKANFFHVFRKNMLTLI